MGYPWRIVRVLGNHEKKVADHLTARSVENYLPLIVQKSEWTDRTVTVSRPLFPGYVFVRFTQMQKGLILSTPGVIQNGLGNEIPEPELERIRMALDEGWKLSPHIGSAEGKRVRFRHGVFSGAEGITTDNGSNVNVVLALSSCQSFSVEAKLDAIDVLS